MSDSVHAISANGHVYHLERIPESVHRFRPELRRFRWYGFKDGDRWSIFRDKSDLERAVAHDEPAPVRGPHARDTDVAEFLSTYQGKQILDTLEQNYLKRRAQQ
jgi:hypothetical protein